MPCLIVPRSQEPILAYPELDPRREPCLLAAEQGNDLIECRSCCREHVPRTPPSSPKATPSICAEPHEACPSTYCVLLLVDRKIEAHQANLSLIQHLNPLGSYPPAFNDCSISGMKLACSDEPMHRTTPLRKVSSASEDDDMTVINSRCPSSRSSGAITLVNDPPSDNREVKAHSTATDDHNQHNIALSPRTATQNSSPKSPAFNFFSLRSSREAIADAPRRLCALSKSKTASLPRPSVTGWQISSPKPIGSSAIPDIAALPLECKQSKTKSWPGPCSQLPRSDIASRHKATTRSKSHECDFACASCKEHKARCDGRISSCENCLTRGETCSFRIYSSSLQPLKEHAKGEDAIDEPHAAIMEEEHSHFSDYSTDEDDDDEMIPSNVRLPNSLGRLSQRSKTRLSLSGLFSRS